MISNPEWRKPEETKHITEGYKTESLNKGLWRMEGDVNTHFSLLHQIINIE